jgi:hypothetical protein
MEFSEAIEKIEVTLKGIGSDISGNEYDGVIVKKLESSNTLDEGRTTNQTHIAITGNQMDLFPYVRADGYFEVEYNKEDTALKKYFIAQIPVYIHGENVRYLEEDTQLFSEDEQLVHVSIVRSRRNNAADQIQMSMTNIDSPVYVKYRKLVHAKSYMILLKRKQKLMYDLYSVKEADGDSVLKELNNGFYKLPTNTPVKLDEIMVEDEGNTNRVLLPFEKSKECARQIVDCIYKLDAFERIKSIIKANDKYIKIVTDEVGGNYLQSMFVKASSMLFDAKIDDKVHVFTDKDYSILIEGINVNSRLSTEWVSTNLGENGSSANYLLALISVVNTHYADVFQIYEESGKWYMEHLPQHFLWERIPEVFHTSIIKRYITSLLAKPFVILTGNSGTGKTRISKQFSEYLEKHSHDGKKNWTLVPVGADWTDNTKILGFYNPLANEGKGKYEKTEVFQIIEQANSNPNIPYFIILDEMNLSHVERYFADFLSHMETENVPFVLDGYDGQLAYPSNVFVVGTVNIDETTYMFSPKVLDRANVIEFKPNEDSVLDLFLNPAKANDIPLAAYGIAEAFLNTAKRVRTGGCNIDEEILAEAQRVFRKVYKITEKYGYEFAFRSVKEIRQYIVAAYELLENKTDFDLLAAEDEQLLQKILPKIHGNKKEIGQLLEELDALCDQENLQLSGEKIKQMKGKLAAVQYASFI